MKSSIKNYWERVTWLEVAVIAAIATVLMYGMLHKMGTISSGYHFLDDHELIRLEVTYEESANALGETMAECVVGDLHWRFRPLYWVERTFVAFFFGTNMLFWNYYTAIKGIITFGLFYFFARYLKCNPIISGLFTCVVLFGTQFTPWYRSANQENTGLMLCALTLCLIAAQFYYKKYQSVVFNILIVVSAILCGLVKESFTLVMPAFAALKLMLEYEDMEKGKLIDCFKRNWWVYSIIAVTFLIHVGILLFYVGVDQVSYAGFHEETRLEEYWQGIVTTYRLFLHRYVKVAFLLLVVWIVGAGKQWKRYGGYALIGCYIMLVQLVAHAKSVMADRYLIPWIVGYAGVFVILSYKMLRHTKVLKLIAFCVLFVLLYQETLTGYAKGREYAYEGWMTSLYFQGILDKTNENDPIISAFCDEELNLSTECWMEVHGRTQVYSYKRETDELVNFVQLRGEEAVGIDWQNVKVVTCYDYQVEDMLTFLGLTDASQYSVNVNEHYAVIALQVE